jgi:hypothetical protein
MWELIDYNKYKIEKNETDENGNPYTNDYWYVLKENSTTAKIVYDTEMFNFLDGSIKLDKLELTNVDANAKFHFQYVVEAIQKANVPDPLAEQGHGPWWGFALGDGQTATN